MSRNGARSHCVNVRRLSSKLGLEENAVRARTHLPDQTVSSAEETWGQYTAKREITVVTLLRLFHCEFLSLIPVFQWASRYLNIFFQLFLPSVSITPSPSAPPVRLCPPLSSPEDAGVNLFTAAGFLSYVQSTTRRAYQQVLEVLDNSHRRWFLFLAPENFKFVHIHKIFLHDINHILMSPPGLDQSIFV